MDVLEKVELCMYMQVVFVQSFGRMQLTWKEEEKMWRCSGAPEGRDPFWLL
jgi:hypothetical protein